MSEVRIVRLEDAREHAGTAAQWLLEEWPDPKAGLETRKARLLDSGDYPATLLAMSGQTPVGLVAFTRFRRHENESPSLFLDAVYIDEPFRGQGIGSALLEAASAAAAAFESRLFVYTAVAGWYQHRGWSVIDTEPDGHCVLSKDLGGRSGS